MTKKTYFQEPTLASIVNSGEPLIVNDVSQIASTLLELRDGHYVVIEGNLVPDSYPNSRKFLKHAPFVQVKHPDSIDEAVEMMQLPWQYRKVTFDKLPHFYFPGYSVKPYAQFQDDKRERRVRLVELCEALRILSYGLQQGSDIKIERIYAESKRASKDGATIAVSVPSRTDGQPRYRFKMTSVVLDANDPSAHAVANGFHTDISFPAKRWFFRYNYYDVKEDSNVVNIFAPEIAAYFKLIYRGLHELDKPNQAPLAMSIFGIPTRLTTDYYKKLLSKVVVRDSKPDKPDKKRKPNKAEQEIMLWALVKEKGYMNTLFRRKKIDENLKDIEWKIV